MPVDHTRLDRLLSALDVQIHAFAVCGVGNGGSLNIPRMESIVLHYVVQGEGYLTTNGGDSVRLIPGSLVISPRNQGHALSREPIPFETSPHSHSGDDPAVNYTIGDGLMGMGRPYDTAGLLTICATLSADCSGLAIFDHLPAPFIHVPKDGCMPAISLSMRDEIEKPRFGTQALLEALLKQCLIVAIRDQLERGDVSLLPFAALHDRRVLDALMKMLDQPGSDHTVAQLARAVGMSRSQFSERFAQAFHRPPIDLLKQIRLHRAAKMLRTTRIPVGLIALAVGYASRSYFSRSFKAAYGMDPQLFRREGMSSSGHFLATADSSSNACDAKSVMETMS